MSQHTKAKEDPYIGNYIQRQRKDRVHHTNPYHLVESTMAGFVITHCGRKMFINPHYASMGILFASQLIYRPDLICQRCQIISI